MEDLRPAAKAHSEMGSEQNVPFSSIFFLSPSLQSSHLSDLSTTLHALCCHPIPSHHDMGAISCPVFLPPALKPEDFQENTKTQDLFTATGEHLIKYKSDHVTPYLKLQWLPTTLKNKLQTS